MKINKVVIYILFAIILNNCSTYSKEGVYYTKNIKNYITTQYNYFELKFNEKVIKLYFPRQVQKSLDDGYNVTFSTILIPYITANEKDSINYFYIGNYVGNKDQKKN